MSDVTRATQRKREHDTKAQRMLRLCVVLMEDTNNLKHPRTVRGCFFSKQLNLSAGYNGADFGIYRIALDVAVNRRYLRNAAVSLGGLYGHITLDQQP